MHRKSDSEATSVEASTPPRSPRRPLYFVQSPSHHDLEKMSYDGGEGASSPAALGSPAFHHHHHPHYHCSPIHHSRESSSSRFSGGSLKQQQNSRYGYLLNGDAPAAPGWKRLNGRRRRGGLFGDGGGGDVDEELDVLGGGDHDGMDDGDGGEGDGTPSAKFYMACFLLCFVVLFSLFSLILWATSKSYSPRLFVKRVVFHDFTLQAGMDHSGVPTDMLSLNSTVRMSYYNRGTFFGVHVTSTPLELHYYDLKLASGQFREFYQSRQSQRNVTAVVGGHQVPLYGGILPNGDTPQKQKVNVPLNLTFRVRSRAYILGRLVTSKFYKNVRCPVTLDGSKLGKPVNIKGMCIYK